MVEKEVEECMEYMLKKVQRKEINRRHYEKSKEKILIKKKKQYKKDPVKFCKRHKAWRDNNLYYVQVLDMYASIKKRCKNNGGTIGKTKYHIEGYGWVVSAD